MALQKAMKKHKVGFETEFLVLEENGAVSSRADDLISKVNLTNPKYLVYKEYVHNTLEIGSIANVKVRKSAQAWVEVLSGILETASKMDLRIYPFGIYPGRHVPTPRTDDYYRMCETVMGPEKYVYSTGHSMGFHLHYCLPYGTFNRETREIRQLFRSKYKDDLINLHNLMIAIDPAATNFMESSPFLDGRHFAKDARLLIYRNMKARLNGRNIRGLYSSLEIFGSLPNYVHSVSELAEITRKRYSQWKKAVIRKCPQYLGTVESRHPLQFSWGPLRINRLGTLEYRGMDMNLPSHIIGSSLLIKYLLKRVREEELHVRPSDIGIKSPFRIEGNTLYVPPIHHVRESLQYDSAIHGFENDSVYRYTKNMALQAMKSMPAKNDPGVSRVKRMLDERKTKSDQILEDARKAGWEDGKEMDDETARELALKGCSELEDEVRRLLDRELIIDFEN